MKQLMKPDMNILRLVRQGSIPEDSEWKLSQYVIRIDLEDHILYFHTFTKECLVCDPSEELPEAVHGTKQTEQYRDLIERRFYVPQDSDETAAYCNLLSLLRNLDTYHGITSYTILPTTYCNARCFYCYELGYHFISMSDENTDKLISFIEKTHADEEIRLNWFGGEPLLGKNLISRVTAALREKEISFKSSIVTNSSLFTEPLILEAISQWNLKGVQITLDGDEEEYNRRKNYFDTSVSPFTKVIQNMVLLHNHGIGLFIRLNTDYENLDSMKKLAVRLNALFEDKSNITVYAHPLFSMQAGKDCLDIWKKSLEIEKLFRSYGFKTMEKRGTSRFKTYYCMNDNPSHIVINADGMLYGCEHCQKETQLCSLDEIPQKSTKKTVTVSDLQEKCRHCAFLPDCTEFSSCPDISYDCKAMRLLQLRDTLQQKFDQNY